MRRRTSSGTHAHCVWGLTSVLELPCVSWGHLWMCRHPYLTPQGLNFCTELLHLWGCFCLGIQPLVPPRSPQGAPCYNPAPSPQIFPSPTRIPWARPTHSIATSTALLGAAGLQGTAPSSSPNLAMPTRGSPALTPPASCCCWCWCCLPGGIRRGRQGNRGLRCPPLRTAGVSGW